MTTKEPTLAEGLKQLEELVREFEVEELDLEKAIPRFKEGLQLAKSLKTKLDKLANEIKDLR